MWLIVEFFFRCMSKTRTQLSPQQVCSIQNYWWVAKKPRIRWNKEQSSDEAGWAPTLTQTHLACQLQTHTCLQTTHPTTPGSFTKDEVLGKSETQIPFCQEPSFLFNKHFPALGLYNPDIVNVILKPPKQTFAMEIITTENKLVFTFLKKRVCVCVYVYVCVGTLHTPKPPYLQSNF